MWCGKINKHKNVTLNTAWIINKMLTNSHKSFLVAIWSPHIGYYCNSTCDFIQQLSSLWFQIIKNFQYVIVFLETILNIGWKKFLNLTWSTMESRYLCKIMTCAKCFSYKQLAHVIILHEYLLSIVDQHSVLHHHPHFSAY